MARVRGFRRTSVQRSLRDDAPGYANERRRRPVTDTISVITVCKDAVGTIECAVRSVEEQSHPQIEHVVIDGASTVGTAAVLERHRHRLAYLSSEPDRASTTPVNKGIAASTGEILFFLNADDRFADPHVVGRRSGRLRAPAARRRVVRRPLWDRRPIAAADARHPRRPVVAWQLARSVWAPVGNLYATVLSDEERHLLVHVVLSAHETWPQGLGRRRAASHPPAQSGAGR
jgi:glycosyltransferase involved in cell wall biosynthesis